MDPTTILARLGSEENPPTDEELDHALTEFKALGRNAVAAGQPDEAANLRKAVGLIQAEIDDRAEAAAQAAAEAAELMDAFEDEPETDEPEAEVDTQAQAREQDAFDALLQSARNARARIDAEAQPENPYPHVRVTGMGQASAITLDHNTTTKDVADIFAQYARGKNRGRETFVRMLWDYDDNRKLDNDMSGNQRIVDAVLGNGATSFEAIAAAGGICGPLETVYDIPLIGSRGRPVRDALTRFGADRGGVRYIAAPRISQDPVDGSVAVWTSANDTSPSSPAEKPCPHIDCDEICEVEVDAITACLKVGNFQARFSPEQWANALAHLGILHDRVAEQALLADIDAGSIDATYASGQGTIGNVLGAVDRAVAAIRSRERLGMGTGFRLILDGWLRPALRSQFTVQAPAGTASALALADAQIDQYFAARGVTVTYTMDDAIFGAQSDGALLNFPASTTMRIFPEGTWWFLDGGTLDLGTEIVDSTLIAQNDRQAFMETFEKAAKRTAPCGAEGDDSLSITVGVDDACLDVCMTS